MTAYRGDDYSELCVQCRAPTERTCRSCGVPVCASHIQQHRLCAACTALLDERLATLGPPPMLLKARSPVLIVVGLGLLVSIGVAASWVVGGAAVAVCLAARALLHSGPERAWRLRHDEILRQLLDRARARDPG